MYISDLQEDGEVCSKFWGPTAEGGMDLWWLRKDWCWSLEVLPDNTASWTTFKYHDSSVPTCVGCIPADQMLAMANYIIDNHDRMQVAKFEKLCKYSDERLLVPVVCEECWEGNLRMYNGSIALSYFVGPTGWTEEQFECKDCGHVFSEVVTKNGLL